MRVAMVVGAFPEVSTTFILDQVTGLLRLGHDVHVFARAPFGSAPVHSDVARYNLAPRIHYWWSSLDAIRNVLGHTASLLRLDPRRHARTLMRSFDPRRGVYAPIGRWWSYAATMLVHEPFDVVMAQFGPNGRIALTLRDLGAFDAPIATTWLGYDLSRILKEKSPDYYSELFARSELMLPLSQHFRDRLRKLGCPSEKITVHHLGIDVARFAYRERSIAPGLPVKIITVCRLVEKKGIEYGLEALAKLAARGLSFEYHLVGEGPLAARIAQRVRELGLSERVTLHGVRTRDEVVALLEQAHVFLSPSVTARNGDEEGVPTAIKEAMACGLPVVSTFHAAIPEVVQSGDSGLLVQERDVAALSDSLAQLITQPQRWSRMALAARRVIEQEYESTLLNQTLADRLGQLALDYRSAQNLRASA